MSNISPESARQKVLGPAGTDVVLTIRREGVDEPFDVTVTRGKITVPSVESEMLENNIAYIRLNTFGENTASELRAQLKDLLDQNPRGIILDLRNNGGGYLITAVDVASQFLSDGVVLYEQYGDGSRDEYRVKKGGLATDLPLVVLVNEGTASASEIVSGAIQDYGRGQLVGVKTYGKGSVQNWIPLDNDGAVRITIARWLTPKERTIDRQGLEPDVVVEMTEEDYKNDRDPQLQKAIELLLQQQP
jgi:carboxyl-terminal processing protease